MNIEWSWLLYWCMPLRPTGCTLAACCAEPAAEDVDVGLVVGRRRSGTPSACARRSPPRRLRRSARPRCSSSLLAQLDQLLVGRVPHLVALEHEVLEAEARAAVLDHVRRPRAEVLDAADRATVGGVDVDPVVGEARRPRARPARRSGSRGSAGRRAAACDVRRAPAGPWPRSSCEMGIDEMTSVAG